MARHALIPVSASLTSELGAVSILWAWIDNLLTEFVGDLAGLETAQMSEIFGANTDIRARIQIAKGMAFVKKTDEEWFQDLVSTLDWIDNDLRGRRNLFLHARWGQGKPHYSLSIHRTKLVKPQAFQLALQTKLSQQVHFAEVRRLTKDLRDAFFDIFYLATFFDAGHPLSDEVQGLAEARSSPSRLWRLYLRQVGHVPHRRRAQRGRQRQRKS